MLKLLQICVEGNTGSTGRLAESIGRLVKEHGWESYIAHGRFPRPSKSKILKIGNKIDVYSHVIETRLFDRHCLGSRKATIKLINQIKQIKPDVIHLHHLHGYYINIQVLFAFLKATAVPVIWTFHDCWSITGHCTHFSAIGCERWKTECFKCPQKKEYPSSLLFDRSTSNFILKKELFNSVSNLTVVPVSNWLDGIVGDSFMNNVPRKVIYNGVDLNKFKPLEMESDIKKKLNIGNRSMILGVASPWGKKKGFNDFIALSRLINSNIVIVMVGVNDRELAKLPDNVIGLKKTESQEELRCIYASADLFINFSVEETFGLTTAEALACGTPALVYDTTACPEIVDNGSGFVVQHGDLKSVLTVIDIVREKGSKHFEESCRERAVKLFDLKKCLTAYYNLYNEKLQVN